MPQLIPFQRSTLAVEAQIPLVRAMEAALGKLPSRRSPSSSSEVGTDSLSRLRGRGTMRSMVEGAATGTEPAMRAPILTQKRAKTLRRSLTRPEQTLWSLLRRNQQGLHFRRQHAVGPYILDFYCASAKLCVEVDGPSHEDHLVEDGRRTRWLAEQGIRVVRFSADEVEGKPAAVLAALARAAAPSTS